MVFELIAAADDEFVQVLPPQPRAAPMAVTPTPAPRVIPVMTRLPAFVVGAIGEGPKLFAPPDREDMFHAARIVALALAADDGRVIRPDIARALVSRLVAGAQSHLRLLAAIPQAEVPAGFVSAPLDLGQISVLHDLAERRVSKLVAALA